MLPDKEDSALSISDCSLCKAKGLPLKRLCLAWWGCWGGIGGSGQPRPFGRPPRPLRPWFELPLPKLTRDVQDWKPDSCPKELQGLAEAARVWPPSEEDRAKWLGVKCPGSRLKLPRWLLVLEVELPTREKTSAPLALVVFVLGGRHELEVVEAGGGWPPWVLPSSREKNAIRLLHCYWIYNKLEYIERKPRSYPKTWKI